MVFSLVKLRDKTIQTPPSTPWLCCPVCSFLAIAQHYFWEWEGEVTAKRAHQFSSLNVCSKWRSGSPSSLRAAGLNQLLNFFIDPQLQCNLFAIFRKRTKNRQFAFACFQVVTDQYMLILSWSTGLCHFRMVERRIEQRTYIPRAKEHICALRKTVFLVCTSEPLQSLRIQAHFPLKFFSVYYKIRQCCKAEQNTEI